MSVTRRAFAALSKDPTLGFVLLDRGGTPIWATPSVLSMVDFDLGAEDPFANAAHPDDAVLCAEIFAEERAGAADSTYSVERRFELTVRLRSPQGMYRSVALHLLNLHDDPDVEGYLLELSLANQEASTVAAFDAAASGAPMNDVVAELLGTLESGGTGNSQAAVFDAAGTCIASSKSAPIVAGDDRGDPRWEAAVRTRLDLCVDIRSVQTGELLGVLETCSNFPDVRPFTRALINSVARRTALVIEGDRNRRELLRHAGLDPLTGLLNRRAFREALNGVDPNLVLQVAFIDINRFKAVNDTFGHACGDRVLIEVARRAAAFAGPTDFVARLGGDEFAFVRGGVAASDCTFDLDALVGSIDGSMNVGEAHIEITCSAGMAIGPAAIHHMLLADADDAMYQRKRRRRT